MRSRCGQSALMWENRLSIQAWSVGVPGRPEVLGDRAHRDELAGGARGHLRPVVRHREQHRRENVNVGIESEWIEGRRVLAGFDQLQQPCSFEGVDEHHLHLRRGLLGGDELCDLLAGHEVHHREHRVPRTAVKTGHVVDPDRVAAVVRPFREWPALRTHDPARTLENQPVGSENTPDGGRGDTHQPEVAATVRELSVRPIDIAPSFEQLEDLGHLLRAQTMHRVARLAVIQAAAVTSASPSPRPALLQLQVAAGAAMLPATSNGLVDQAQQLLLGGRVDPARDPATQSQRPFPSASINRTPISLIASESRATSALASTSSGSRAPGRTPGRELESASSAPCLAT